MRIIVNMTRVTVSARIGLLYRGRMTQLTFKICMTAQQGELSERVMLKTMFLPADFCMAISTIFAE